MAIARKDEILEKVLSGDATAVPRYNLRRPDGTLIGENITLELANIIAQNGTPVNAAALNEMLAASGVTAGTAYAYTLAQEGFALFDGAPIRFRLHTASGQNPTININGTGAKPLVNAYGGTMPIATPAGTWIDAVYSSVADAYIISAGKSTVITKKTLTSNATAVSMPLSADYKAFRLVFVASCNNGTNISITSNATVHIARTIGHQIISASNSALTYYEGYAQTIAKSSYTGNFVNTTAYGSMLIANGDSDARIGGTLVTRFTSDVFTAILSGAVSTITISGYFEKGSTFILEGMPE